MRYLVGFVLFLLALGTLRLVGCGDPCWSDSDCDDGNPCTNDICWGDPYQGGYDPDAPWLDCSGRDYYCRNPEVDTGTPCEVDGQPGVCGGGRCRLEGEAPDGGV